MKKFVRITGKKISASLYKYSFFLSILVSSYSARAQNVYIPDYIFANWLYNHGFSTCMVGVQTMDTTCAALLTATTINCSTYAIHDLTGIQYFKNLQYLSAWGCQLTYVPALPRTLKSIDFYSNQLTTLPPLPDSLQSLSADENNLTSLPALPPTLTDLAVGHNQLTSLPPLPSGMTLIWVYNNPGLACLPPIINFAGSTNGNSIMIDSTLITCMPNPIPHSNYWLPFDTLPICNLFNSNGCPSLWNLEGRTYLDTDHNCTTTFNEPVMHGIKVLLYDSSYTLVQQTYSNAEGFYSFDNALGTYHISADTSNLPFDLLCPSGNTYTSLLTSNDSTEYGLDFRLACKTSFDIGVKSILGHRFRPAHSGSVRIQAGDLAQLYGVHCASGISGTVTVTFSGPVTYVGPDPGALVPSVVTANTLTYNIADFGNTNPLTAFNIVMHTDSLATTGAPICFTVSVTPLAGDGNTSNNTMTMCFSVQASFDPNEKEVYPAGAIQPALDPNLVYTLHFQNTGTAVAEHIYITDTLDADLDWSSFQLLAYSHPPVVQILDGGIARFNFPNINLPDSNSNEPASHGFIQYRIRAKSSLAAGTQILNTGHIYFDFNPPVSTNTTVNTVASPSGLSNPGTEMPFLVFPNPAKDDFTVYIPRLAPGAKILCKVFDAFGREIESLQTHEVQFRLSAAGWSPGLYFLRLETEQGNYIQKILKD